MVKTLADAVLKRLPETLAIPVEASGRHVHLTQADVEKLFGTSRIKDGKVNQMIDQLADELRPVANGSKESAGAIPLLIDNYKTVIQNIDKKIEREEARLVTWEKRMKAKFARLDTLLSEMNNTMQANASALAQLSSGSS